MAQGGRWHGLMTVLFENFWRKATWHEAEGEVAKTATAVALPGGAGAAGGGGMCWSQKAKR